MITALISAIAVLCCIALFVLKKEGLYRRGCIYDGSQNRKKIDRLDHVEIWMAPMEKSHRYGF
jgi:hypothetical protein